MADTIMRRPNQQRICALRLPGTSRARFADGADLEIELGDWVTIDTGAGEEAAQIVVAPDQWIEPVSMDDVPLIIRKLQETELATIASNIERALALINDAGDVVRSSAPGIFLCGLRLTLAGDRAIAAYIGDEPDDESDLTKRLSDALAMPVHLEQERPGDPERGLLGGGTGRPGSQRPETFRELLEQRFDVVRDPGSFAPQGMPRLGSRVRTEQGIGRLIAIDIRHWKATVELDDGDEISVGVDELRET